MSYIELKNVSKVIERQIILDNVNLTLEKGKVYGFWGRNGSGKTMLFKTVAGLLKPTKGIVKIQDEILYNEIDFPQSIGIMLENPSFIPYLSGLKNLELLASIQNKIDKKTIKNTIERVGLNPHDKKSFRKYSLGMKQKLALAQALMEQPNLLVLDEPSNSLDEKSVENLKTIIREERDRGAIILIASHIKEDLEELCDRIFHVSKGRVGDEYEIIKE